MKFLQIVGITADELVAMEDWDTESMLNLMAKDNPLHVADLNRDCLMDQPEFNEQVQQGISRDGSSTGIVYAIDLVTEQIDERYELTIGAFYLITVLRGIRGRIPFDRELFVQSSETGIAFIPSDHNQCNMNEDGLKIELTPEAAMELAELIEPVAGEYTWPSMPELKITVIPTEITDQDGNVKQVIG